MRLKKSEKKIGQDYSCSSLNEDKLKKEIVISLTVLSWCTKKMKVVVQLIEQLEKVNQKLDFIDLKIKIEIRSQEEKIINFKKSLIDLETKETHDSKRFLKEKNRKQKRIISGF